MSLWRVVGWEWRKLRTRRVVWALAAGLVGFAALMVFVRFADFEFQRDADIVDELIYVPGTELPAVEVDVNCTELVTTGALPTETVADIPSGYTVADADVPRTRQECEKEISERQNRLDKLVADFTLPGAPAKAVRWAALLGIPFAAFLTVLVVGSEYVWGTLRTSLMKGVGRTRYLAAKLTLLGVVLAAVWLAAVVAVILSSLVATALSSGIGHGDVGAGFIGDVVGVAARSWLASLPYVLLATVLAILFSRSAGGMLAAAGLSVGYFFLELFSVGRLIKMFDGVAAFRWFGSVAEYDLGWNTAAWLFGDNGEPIPGFALGGAIGVSEYPGELHAAFVQLAYLAVLAFLAFRMFRRRDVVGPSG